jgi:hypothetical protein
MGGQNNRDPQRQLDDLAARLSGAEAGIAALEEGAQQSSRRADLSDERMQANSNRISELEDRGAVDREMILALQAEGLVSREEAANLRDALATSRMIGAAVGIIMAFYGVTETGAFDILKKASMDNNVKLRAVAEEVVLTGSANGLPSRR